MRARPSEMDGDRERVVEALPAYEVGKEIGRGGWSVVLAGRHRQLDRPVAIKQLLAARGTDDTARARFLSEARLIASLDHPHIVPVFDYVERDGLYLLVMEHLPGGTLWERFTERGMRTTEAVAVILAICGALQYAHDRGILHRDVKPENVLFTDSGLPKLGDFGIAKLLSDGPSRFTSTGVVMATPAYIPPERAVGEALTPAADVYSAAVVLYELLSGRLPFRGQGDVVAQLYQHVHEPPRPLGEVAPFVSRALSDAVDRALSKRPDERYVSAEAFGAALGQAAGDAWGAGWLRATSVTVMAGGAIMAAAERARVRLFPRQAEDRLVLPEVRQPVGPAETDRLAESGTPVLQSFDPGPPSTVPMEVTDRAGPSVAPTEEVAEGTAPATVPMEVAGTHPLARIDVAEPAEPVAPATPAAEAKEPMAPVVTEPEPALGPPAAGLDRPPPPLVSSSVLVLAGLVALISAFIPWWGRANDGLAVSALASGVPAEPWTVVGLTVFSLGVGLVIFGLGVVGGLERRGWGLWLPPALGAAVVLVAVVGYVTPPAGLDGLRKGSALAAAAGLMALLSPVVRGRPDARGVGATMAAGVLAVGAAILPWWSVTGASRLIPPLAASRLYVGERHEVESTSIGPVVLVLGLSLLAAAIALARRTDRDLHLASRMAVAGSGLILIVAAAVGAAQGSDIVGDTVAPHIGIGVAVAAGIVALGAALSSRFEGGG